MILLIIPKLPLMAMNDEPRLATCMSRCSSFNNDLLTTSGQTDAEVHLTGSTGLALLSLALLTILMSGIVPLGKPEIAEESRKISSPYVGAFTTIVTIYHAAAAFQSYTAYVRYSSAMQGLGALISGLLCATGLWCIMFEGGSHVSRRTGRGKRTSGWPFKNSQAGTKQK